MINLNNNIACKMKAKRKTQHHTKTSGWLQSLVLAGVPHRISLTNNTTIVEIDRPNGKIDKWIISDRFLSWKSLGFIGRTKAAAAACGIPKISKMPASYYNFFRKQQGEFRDVVEVDVNKAYWSIARNKGYISEDIYQEGLTVDKETRLIAFGAIATVKSNYEFDGEEYIHKDETSNPITRSYFFDVAFDLGVMMSECLIEVGVENCYFFWVDAFFVSKKAAKAVSDFFDTKKLGVKYKEIEYMKTKETDAGWSVVVKEQKNSKKGAEKPFFFPKGDSRKKLISQTYRNLKSGNQLKNTV